MIKRFIPAHAGNMKQEMVGAQHTAVHPRTRGEHLDLKTHFKQLRAVHPRTRGEHREVLSRNSTLTGSSPHTRGTFSFAISVCPYSAVHPRTRGEHLNSIFISWLCVGSSPHTRGTFLQHRFFIRQFRFIPAHAGNIPDRSAARRMGPVHPRTRGEHWICPTRSWSAMRFIPAHAGNIQYSRLYFPALAGSSPHTRGTYYLADGESREAAVHPRTRGEHIYLVRGISQQFGSSPHTRGTFRLGLS